MLQQHHLTTSSSVHSHSCNVLLFTAPKTHCRPVLLLPAQIPASANFTCHNSSATSSRSHVIASAAPRKRRAGAVPDGFDSLRTSLESARQELANLAAPGSSWPPQAQPLEAAEQSLGGRCLLVSCGQYGEEHPLARQPAYALFQLVFCSCQAAKEDTPYRVNKKPVVFEHSKDSPQDLSHPMVYIIAYEVDGKGWPTGAAYNSATAFERATTKKPSKKVLASCRIIHQGRELTPLMNYYNKELLPFGVEVPPLQLVRVVGDWARDQLEAVGVKVMRL